MSDHMEISIQNPAEVPMPEKNGVFSTPLISEDKVFISVEVCLKSSSTARNEDIRTSIERMLEKRSLSYVAGPIPVPQDDPFLHENVHRILICTDEWTENNNILLFWQVKPIVHVFQLSEEGPCEEMGGDGQLPSFNEWSLPAKELDGMWESLIYDYDLKERLLRYAATALFFGERRVDPFLISWNRIVLLHGPPGTGKTSLCRALAQKLSVRFNGRYPQSQLIEINAHSLFSKWFSESGKLVAKLFHKIQEMVEEEDNLVFVLMDEVESLAVARTAAVSGSEPSDSIRAVNALLTQLDKLKDCPNVIILTTSNITKAIDIAFIDRADIKAYVGPPSLQARYEILRSCFHELVRAEVLFDNFQESEEREIPSYGGAREMLGSSLAHSTISALCKPLMEAAEVSQGLSGRSLRKLPFLAHAKLAGPGNSLAGASPSRFLSALVDTAKREISESTFPVSHH